MFEQDWYGFTGRPDVQQAPAPCPATPDYAMLPLSDWRNTPEKRARRTREGDRRRAERDAA